MGSRSSSAAAVVLPGVAAAVTTLPGVAPGALAFSLREDFAFSATDIGLCFSGFYLCAAISARLCSSGRTRHLRLVQAALLVTAVMMLIIAIGGNRWILILGSVVAGFANGLSTPSVNVLIATLAPVRHQGFAFGIRMSSVPTAASLAAIGTGAATALGFGWRELYGVLCLLCVVVALALLTLAGRSPVEDDPGRQLVVSSTSFRPRLGVLVVVGLLSAAGSAVLPVFLVDGVVVAGVRPELAVTLLAIGSWLGIGMRLVTGVFSDHLHSPYQLVALIVTSLLIGSVGMGGLALGAPHVWILVASAVVTFGLGWVWPGPLHMFAMKAFPGRLAYTTARMQSMTFIGALIGPSLFGVVAEHVSYGLAWAGSSGLMALAAALLLHMMYRPHRGVA